MRKDEAVPQRHRCVASVTVLSPKIHHRHRDALCIALLPAATAFVPPRTAFHRTPPLRSTTAAYEKERTPVFNFDAAPEATAALWERIDDVVMGGVSSSKIVVGDGGAEWRGIVRTDGGGFCGTAHGGESRRTRLTSTCLDAPLDLSKADGVYVDAILTSDADVSRRAWKLTLRTAASRSEIVYSAEWAPRGPDGVGGPTFVPFSDFKLVRGPRIVEGAPPLKRNTVRKCIRFWIDAVAVRRRVNQHDGGREF